ARAVIESASELDVIPAAIRYVLSMRDKSAVPAIAKVYPTLAADQPPDSDRPDRIHRWLESGRAGSAASAVYALTVLAERADASLMKQVLRQARDGDASWLARY